MGAIAYEFIYGRPPFYRRDRAEKKALILKGKLVFTSAFSVPAQVCCASAHLLCTIACVWQHVCMACSPVACCRGRLSMRLLQPDSASLHFEATRAATSAQLLSVCRLFSLWS